MAKRGQVLIFCSANLHSAWHNEHEVSRKTLLMAFAPAGVACGAPRVQVEKQGLEFFEKLRPRMRPDRAHLVPKTEHNWPYFISVEDGAKEDGAAAEASYQQLWPEGVAPVAASSSGRARL